MNDRLIFCYNPDINPSHKSEIVCKVTGIHRIQITRLMNFHLQGLILNKDQLRLVIENKINYITLVLKLLFNNILVQSPLGGMYVKVKQFFCP